MLIMTYCLIGMANFRSATWVDIAANSAKEWDTSIR